MEAKTIRQLAQRIHVEKDKEYKARQSQFNKVQASIGEAHARVAAAFQTFAHTQFVQNCAAFNHEVIALAQEVEIARDNNRKKMVETKAKIERCDLELSSLTENLERACAEVAEQLRGDETFQRLAQVLAESEQVLRIDQEKYEALLNEVAEKLPAFNDSKVFQYLLNIRFASDAYKGKGLVARLDGMLARRTEFFANKERLLLLQGIQAEAQRRLSQSTEDYTAALKVYEAYETDALNREDIQAIRRAVNQWEQERDAAQEILSCCEVEQSQYLSAEDGLSLSAKGLIYKFLQQQDPQLLARYAAETPSVEDDMALNVVQQELASIDKLKIEMRDARARLQDTENALKKAKDLLREIDREPNLSSKHYKYTSESDVTRLLDGFMSGANGTHELLNGLKRVSIFVAPAAPVHTSAPTASRTSSFSSSSSVDGGSFKTTNSF